MANLMSARQTKEANYPSEWTLREARRDGRLAFFRLGQGGAIFYLREDLDAFVLSLRCVARTSLAHPPKPIDRADNRLRPRPAQRSAHKRADDNDPMADRIERIRKGHGR